MGLLIDTNVWIPVERGRIGRVGEVFGSIAAKLTETGRGSDFRVQDLWLAAQAIHRDFTVLTANGRDFEDVPGLRFVVVTVPR